MRGSPFQPGTFYQHILDAVEYRRHRRNLKNMSPYYCTHQTVQESDNLLKFCNHKNKLNREYTRQRKDYHESKTNEKLLKALYTIEQGKRSGVGKADFKQNMGRLNDCPYYSDKKLLVRERSRKQEVIDHENILLMKKLEKPLSTIKYSELEARWRLKLDQRDKLLRAKKGSNDSQKLIKKILSNKEHQSVRGTMSKMRSSIDTGHKILEDEMDEDAISRMSGDSSNGDHRNQTVRVSSSQMLKIKQQKNKNNISFNSFNKTSPARDKDQIENRKQMLKENYQAHNSSKKDQ